MADNMCKFGEHWLVQVSRIHVRIWQYVCLFGVITFMGSWLLYEGLVYEVLKYAYLDRI